MAYVQRIAAFFVLCDVYRQEAVNPFVPVFVESLQHRSSAAEKRFLVHLISSAPSNREVRRCRVATHAPHVLTPVAVLHTPPGRHTQREADAGGFASHASARGP